MEIRKIEENKNEYMEILLEADPDESIVNKYLEKGDLYLGENDGKAVCVCVITKYDEETFRKIERFGNNFLY